MRLAAGRPREVLPLRSRRLNLWWLSPAFAELETSAEMAVMLTKRTTPAE